MNRLAYAVIALGFLTCIATAQSFPTLEDHLTSGSQLEDLTGGFGAAEEGPARPLIPIALDLIRDFEGWVPRAYNDAAQYCTIGYGHLIALKPCAAVSLGEFAGEMSIDQGRALLEKDTVTARNGVRSLVDVELTDEQFGALTSFVFNVGKQNFANSTLRALLNEGNYEAASGQFARWVKAGGKVLKGLVERRSCEAALFQGLVDYGADGKFHRNSCNSSGAAPDTESLVDIETGE